MGYLLKEALKSLCGLNQWAYAVFWKIGCQNPKLLIWEDCYYETAADSLHLWEGCSVSSKTHTSQLDVQASNGVSSLINKMMMRNQVNIVGEGMVGRAAFTRKHQWILSENYLRDAHPPEVLNEVRHQYSAGMKTVAVIPVLPHGVVQLGSFLAIVENDAFVADVKSLIFQLGCIPGALLSDNYTTDVSSPSIGIPNSVGASFSANLSGNIKMINSASFISDSCNQQSNSSQASRLVDESSDSVQRQVQLYPPITASTFQTPKLTEILVKSRDNHYRSELIPAIKPNESLRSQLENGFTGAIVIPPKLDTWMKQQAPSYDSGFDFNNQSGFGQSGASYSSLRPTEQHISSDSNLQDHVSSNGSASHSFVTSQPRMTGVLNSSAHKNSVSTPLFGRSESNNGMISHLRQNSAPRSFANLNGQADISLSSTHLDGFDLQNADSFITDLVPITKREDHLPPRHLFSGGSHQAGHLTNNNQTQITETARKQRSENDLFQALNRQLALPDDHMPSSELVPGFLHGFPEHKIENRSLRSRNAMFEDSCVQNPAGDDLFDIFSVDFKNKLFNGNQNTSFNGPDMDKHSAVKDSSTSIGEQCPDVNSIIGGISESNVFSGSDHLLDAVVSKVHLAAKQSLSDNVSCRTSLTKISGCPVPSTSPTFYGASMSNQIPGEFSCHPKTLGKAGMGGSSSFRSGCSNDDAGNCSQTSTIYGSQISSWVEQGNNVKRDASVSTVYSKRPEEISKSNRKRLKPGENPRPRPKDRQMIQDRVKELREIVPNGGKCSIDALLERTIKHMLFLQSVTKHADKLKQTGESKIISKEGGLLLKDNFEGGATWAFEVGSQSMVCPIIVEDLNPPRQMLVEMLCEERGFFLEIADIIRGLGLTILKGVMEARNEKIWARFAVEANRDVTRMEIFISLVGLLEQTVKSSAASSKSIANDNMMVHHSFHQAPCIPATDNLQ